MRIVHSMLKDLVAIGDDFDAIADIITNVGLAVEDIHHVGGTVAGVITAKVLRTERHADAAKVHRVFVDAGDGVERHVWCGAFNMQPGDIIPLATPGTVMPDGRAIEPKPILGISSDGMLCSARELDMGDDHSGILILPVDTPLGVPYGEALGLEKEVVYDIDVLRNRPDAYGHLGVARDVAAKFGISVTPAPVLPAAQAPVRSATVELVDGDRCPRFTSIVLSGVKVGPSPDWIARRLTASGMRPINNVVDVSNYVMLETNQPNHAYDFDTLGGGGFRVRLARDGETMITLDDSERTLTADDLLICDATDRPIGIAAIMGGQNTEISDTTTAIALETAWFEPAAIMRSVVRMGLRTEASARFERGMDTHGIERSTARFVELLRLTCPDLVVNEGAVDARAPQLPVPPVLRVRSARVGALLGTPFSAEQIRTLIEPIGFVCTTVGDDLDVLVPTWRPDCTGEVDIIEEVARLHGYDLLGKTVPKSTVPGGLSGVQQRRRRLRDVLLGLGLTEAMPHPFLTAGELEKAGLPAESVRLVNPLVVGDDMLRTSLRPGLLKAIAFNESHRRSGVALFEIGHVYPPSTDVLPAEYEALGIVIAGADAPAAVAVWRELAAAMGWGARLDQSNVPAGLHPARSATLSLGKDTIGAVGEVHPDAAEAFDVTERLAVLELNLSVLLANEPKPAAWKPTSRFPSSDLDLAFVLPDSVTAEKLDKAIRQATGNLLVDLTLFDVYRGTGLPEGTRSLAYRLRLQSLERTLTDDDVAAVRAKVEAATKKMGAVLRG
ncbi:MAG: phenylalanine--tRNA ligase subunit beta [Actinobacteria bacterium]|uniref:Phenylalanine--tRNA ligase beta subunit n=1 Tax=freshwater metagenome TaxID=449393 RepID=A0A6J6A9R8_9ZZZZ|nr:phenylalanine--tRNA ligase subunit beta [Actinomycetota bacterium]MSW78060.1 phenylalanine--tRNA ligase subunit beta [Actinomycetota bacterium]MSZ83383.1 phenylalanine--tRNA ligase subunit beta [Actinomycetota bacterium]MTB18510.1 phenylalanine--tRNA ligase subunit beta [Actinomycetota bacterium]